jgi:hypothetical protein
MRHIIGNKMEMPLHIHGNMYDHITIEAWQQVWDKICRMAYEKKDICEKIITRPGSIRVNGKPVPDSRESTHTQEYNRREPMNSYFLTLENVWKQYSSFHRSEMPHVIPEFKELVVPYSLYNCLGVQSWFRHSFPNCKVYHWDE